MFHPTKSSLVSVTLVAALVLPLLMVPAYSEEPLEPSLLTILSFLGFTNITESTIETFPPGVYEVVLYAEFADHHDSNELSYYPAGSSDFTLIFSGSDGGINGYVDPPVNRTFWFTHTCNSTFGLSMYDGLGNHTYFTEGVLNPDGQNHSKVYLNLDDPEMYLIGFENLFGLGDRDYNDMVFSLRRCAGMYYLNVETDPIGVATIQGTGCYNESDTVQLTSQDYANITTGSRYRFEYWDVDGISQGAGVNPITVSMNANHATTAHYTIQYYLTVTSPYGDPAPSGGWYDDGTTITSSVTSPWPDSIGTRYICMGWTGTGSVPTSGMTSSFNFSINSCSSLTWTWKTQYYLSVAVDPLGLVPIPGEGWYDESTSLTLSAPTAIGYTFTEWTIDSVSQGSGTQSIPVVMNAPHIAIAYYDIPVGGLTVSARIPALNSWFGLNILLIAAVFATSLLTKKLRQRTD